MSTLLNASYDPPVMVEVNPWVKPMTCAFLQSSFYQIYRMVKSFHMISWCMPHLVYSSPNFAPQSTLADGISEKIFAVKYLL